MQVQKPENGVQRMQALGSVLQGIGCLMMLAVIGIVLLIIVFS